MKTMTPHEDLLLDYATGALPEGPALIAATYVALNDDARADVSAMEAVGGALFEAIDPADVSDGLLERTLDSLDDEAGAPMVARPALDEDTTSVIPHALRPYLRGDLSDLTWVRRGKTAEQSELSLSDSANGGGRYKASLLRIKAGQTIPRHTHKVLAGGFTDESGHHTRGSLTVCDGSVEHSPVADKGEDCICLTVLDAPIRMTGPVGRFVNPFLRF